MAGNFERDDMFGGIGSVSFEGVVRCGICMVRFGGVDMDGRVGIVEFAESGFVMPVADPISAAARLNELEIVPINKIAIRNGASQTLLCMFYPAHASI
jgi:hypothetical protein